MSAKIDDRSTKTNKGFMTNQDKTIVPTLLKLVRDEPNHEMTEENLMTALPEMGVNQFFRILGDLETKGKLVRPSPGLVVSALSDQEIEAIVEGIKKQQKERILQAKQRREQPVQKETGQKPIKPPSLNK